MKKLMFFILLSAGLLPACNNESETTTTETNDTNVGALPPRDTGAGSSITRSDGVMSDSASANFLMKAADGGLAEVSAGEMAQQKATNPRVKSFASMMVNDHSGANAQVKSLAAARNVVLPSAPSPEHQQKAAQVNQKSGKAFDAAYMDMMVEDHKKTISLFESASNDTKDTEVKTFIEQTLPKLRAHLDSAQAIRKAVQ